MRISHLLIAGVFGVASASQSITLPITSSTFSTEPDTVALLYPNGASPAQLFGNDGSAFTGGFSTYALPSFSPASPHLTGRTKIVQTLYFRGDDYLTTISPEDSLLQFFKIAGGKQALKGQLRVWGDFSALCFWNPGGERAYGYLFGKKQVVLLGVQNGKKGVDAFEIATWDAPIEASACTIANDQVYFAGKSGALYTFPAAESTAAPALTTAANIGEEITGLSTYTSSSAEYLFVAEEAQLHVLSARSHETLAIVTPTGLPDLELAGIALLQAPLSNHPHGTLAFAFESDDGDGFALASLEPIFAAKGLQLNTKFNPRRVAGSKPRQCPRLRNCSGVGFCAASGGCECFSGYKGRTCAQAACPSNCSSHGRCLAHGVCECSAGFAGPACGWKVVRAKYETAANGADGDDPAIWVAPRREDSRIVTTTKSEEGEGLAVFDLRGVRKGGIAAAEPNNVDVIPGFDLGGRKADLLFAACRGDDTLCLFEMTKAGEIVSIEGGVQPTPDEFEVYGSCVYTSPKTNTTYLFVNSKTSEYLQYTLTAVDGTLHTELTRRFLAGSGGQVEGCVSDPANGAVYIGEEQHGLWKYDAEPDGSPTGTLVDSISGGLWADVEGVTLVEGATAKDGWIIVSCQGVSAYNVYECRAPHKLRRTFVIEGSRDGKVDGVTNTDGIAAMRGPLGEDWPQGVVVVHDDVNRLPNGAASAEASFKIADLGDVLEGL